MEKFKDIQARSIKRKGGEEALADLVTKPLSRNDVFQIHEDLWLEEFTRKVFQSGFYWAVINNKWPGFRDVFWNFNVEKLLMMPPEMLEEKSTDVRIVRNYKKVKTIPANASMIKYAAQEQHGSFSQMVADWPSDDTVGLWIWLKKNGARLGGNTGQYALRAMGKDTFILSRDVEAYLRGHKVIEGGSQSLKSLRAIQSFFTEMQQQSGLSFQEISQTLSFSFGDNHVGFAEPAL